jgi:hypothetical protein
MRPPPNAATAPTAEGAAANKEGKRQPLPSTRATRPGQQVETLAAVHRGWGLPSQDQVRWLLDQGLDADALCRPWLISATTVRFDGNTFTTDPDGERALTFRATDRGEVVDLIAWNPRSGKLASWYGTAFCLGDLDDILNPASFFAGSALRVHADPLAWLRAGRDGIVIVKPEFTYAYLRGVPRLSFADASFARQVRAWLQPPQPRVKFLVEVPAERVAA